MTISRNTRVSTQSEQCSMIAGKLSKLQKAADIYKQNIIAALADVNIHPDQEGNVNLTSLVKGGRFTYLNAAVTMKIDLADAASVPLNQLAWNLVKNDIAAYNKLDYTPDTDGIINANLRRDMATN